MICLGAFTILLGLILWLGFISSSDVTGISSWLWPARHLFTPALLLGWADLA